MRVACEACHELVAAAFALDGEAVRATCPACGHAMRAALTSTASVSAPGTSGDRPARAEAGPRGACPKCGAAVRGDACGACGLAADRMAAYAGDRDAAAPEEVRAAWARAEAAWDEGARHDELLQVAARRDAYAWVAARYRARASDPVAQRQLARLTRAASATLLASASPRATVAPAPYRAARAVLAILVFMIIAGVLYTVVRRQAPGAVHGSPGGGPRTLTPGQPLGPSTIR